MNSIPASAIVSVNPSVIGTGGNPLSLSGILLTNDASIPIGTVYPFPGTDSVSEWFGAESTEATLAGIYFLGFDNSTIKPGTLYLAQYPSVDVAAYIRGGSLGTLSLTDWNLLSGNLIVTMNGTQYTSTAINLSGATSPSNAASLINAAFSSVPAVSWDSIRQALVITSTSTGAASTISFASGTLANALKLTSATGAVMSPGATAAVTPATSAKIVTGDLTALDLNAMKALSGTLTMIVDGHLLTSSTIAPSGAASFDAVATAIAAGFTGAPLTCTWDNTAKKFTLKSATTGIGSNIGFATGTISTALKLTSATGAMMTAGTDAQVNPNATLDNITNITQNWVSFMTTWEPDFKGKVAFADWSNSKNQRYLYVAWDSDVTAIQSNATQSFGRHLKDNKYNGCCVVYPQPDKAAFIMGAISSINFSQKNGRITLAFKSQSGLVPDIIDPVQYQNALANGYLCYTRFATANDSFVNLQDGAMPGSWAWIDTYVNQVYLTNQFQLAIMSLLTTVTSLPYNTSGYAQISAACQDPINEALNFGSIRTGVTLSEQQKSIVNAAAGVSIASSLQNQGYYLQILPATAQNRGLRRSPPCNFWYLDGGCIQKVNLASIDVQ